MDLTTLIREGFRAVCEELITLMVAQFPALSVDASASLGAWLVLPVVAGSFWSNTHMNLYVVPSESVPLPANSSGSNAAAKDVADVIKGVSPTHTSASHVANASSISGIDDNTPLEVD